MAPVRVSRLSDRASSTIEPPRLRSLADRVTNELASALARKLMPVDSEPSRILPPSKVAFSTAEAIAFSSAELLAAMAGAEGLEIPALRADGGAAANDWLMQEQADVLGVPVERPDMIETTALGAAGLAGIALGVWRTSEEFLSRRRFTRFEPQIGPGERARRLAGWRRSVDAALGWARAAYPSGTAAP